MIEGIVTSLKILVIGMGYRGSKSIIIKLIIVKEQRVDGSSAFSKNGCCKVYSSRRESRFLKNKSFYSDFYILTVNSSFIKNNNLIKSQIRSLHNKSDLDPWFIVGFSDGEASFFVSIFKNKEYRLRWQVQAIFSITLHAKDLPLLKQIQSFFGVGTIIISKTTTSVIYRVADLKQLIEVIIPFFDKYPLLSQKRADFELFKTVVDLMAHKEHMTIEGL
jgi:hypothetical protein